MALHSRDIAPTDTGLVRSKPVRVFLRGRDWNGWWDLTDDGKVRISAAYGSVVDHQPIGRRKPEKRAQELLLQVVQRFSFNPVPEIHQARKRRR